jgi:hypothetical protein
LETRNKRGVIQSSVNKKRAKGKVAKNTPKISRCPILDRYSRSGPSEVALADDEALVVSELDGTMASGSVGVLMAIGGPAGSAKGVSLAVADSEVGGAERPEEEAAERAIVVTEVTVVMSVGNEPRGTAEKSLWAASGPA